MKEFSYSIPGEVLFGAGVIKKLPDILKTKKMESVLLVSDQNIAASGLTEKIEAMMKNAKIEFEVFYDVEPNPSAETVHKGVEIFNLKGLNGLICIGGGSPMDTAKAISIVVSNGGAITDYEGVDKVLSPVMPVIAIPTTAGTGSEVTPFTVITDLARNYKLTVVSKKTIPELAMLDPKLLLTLPAPVAASTGIDAFIHALESYLSLAATPISEMYAEKAMQLIGRSIKPFVAHRENIEAAAEMLLGSLFAGIAFSFSRLGNIHAMSHPLSGFFNIPHGIANAVLLPVVLEYNALADQGKYEFIYRCLKPNSFYGEFIPKMLVEEIICLYEELGIPTSLAALNVDQNLVNRMAEDALKSGNILVNPRKTELNDIKELYRKAF